MPPKNPKKYLKNWRQQKPNYHKLKMREYRAKSKKEKKYWRNLAMREFEKHQPKDYERIAWIVLALGFGFLIGVIIFGL